MEFTHRLKNLNFWSRSGLKHFNIKLEDRNAATFFGVNSMKDLPTPDVSPIIWNNVHEPKEVLIPKPASDFFAYLKDAPRSDFFVVLLGMLDYDAGPRIIHTQTELSFYVRGAKVDVTADVAILKRTGGISEYVLLVVEEDEWADLTEGQLMAGAIAAFCQNNLTRKQAGLPSLESQTILGIIMSRTKPAFYKIPITKVFVHQFLEEGKLPTEPMFVERLTTSVSGSHGHLAGGCMDILENRWIILKFFNAHKRLLDDAI